jgi:hypothetical protein
VSKITNIKVLGIALFAVFAFSAVTAASAFAVDEWLFEGLAFAGELATNTEPPVGGALTLNVLTLAGTGPVNTIDCSALFEGTVTGGGPINLVLDLFNLATPQALIEELPGTSLTCETLVDNEACKLSSEAGSETLLWVDELRLGATPLTWESLIELMATAPEFLDHFHHVAFELSCILLNGLKLESLCQGVTSGALTNIATGVLLEFGAGTIASEALECENVVEGTPVENTLVDFEGDLVILHSGGGVLSVS